MKCAERNRKIKKLLTSTLFSKGAVTVRGSRGTAYGWVTINIDYAPRDPDERRTLSTKIWQLFKVNEIEIGTYGYDDPGSDYGFGAKMHLEFKPCRANSELTAGAYREYESEDWLDRD